jgi:hypothetical protein
MPRLKFPRLKTHIFNGHRFRISWRSPKRTKKEKRQKLYNYGSAHLSAPRQLSFSMDPKLHPAVFDLFSTLLHESTHAAFPQLDEDSVLEFEKDFTQLIRRLKIKMEFSDK